MSRNDAYIEGAALAHQGEGLASHWDLELQDTLLDIAAVTAATEPARTRSCANPAERHVLTLHWTLPNPVQRTN